MNQINREVVDWAIARCGSSFGELEKHFPKLSLWLEGEKAPTLRQMESLAKRLYIPLAYLFAQEVPKESIPLTFFRQSNQVQEVSVNLRDLIYDVKAKQDWLREYLDELEEEPLPFVGSKGIHDKVSDIVQSIHLELGLPNNWAASYNNWEEALKQLAEKIEQAGISLIFTSIVGLNSQRPISVDECRGFALVDSKAPFIFINSADSKSAQMFTLAHELAHIFLGESRGDDGYNLHPANDAVERLTDAVAAEFLVPKVLLLDHWQAYPKNYKKLSSIFKVSPIVIARRAKDLSLITTDDFFAFYRAQQEQWQTRKTQNNTGGNFYSMMLKRIGLRFASYIHSAVHSNSLMYRDAYRLTHLKGDSYNTFMEQYVLA